MLALGSQDLDVVIGVLGLCGPGVGRGDASEPEYEACG